MLKKEMIGLREYYQKIGYQNSQWHIGPEHPRMEEYTLKLLLRTRHKRVLEIGYQAGGFAVSVILAMKNDPEFNYTGIDDGSYANSVEKNVICKFLEDSNVQQNIYAFYKGDAHTFLYNLTKVQFDVILVDHYKPLYLREFYGIVKNDLLDPEGYILFHDVLERASKIWVKCQNLCDLFGFSWEIINEIPGGMAVVRKIPNHSAKRSLTKYLQIKTAILSTVATMKLTKGVIQIKSIFKRARNTKG